MSFNSAGYFEGGLTSCERYDLNKGIWQEIASLQKARTKFVAVLSQDNNILIIGGKYMV